MDKKILSSKEEVNYEISNIETRIIFTLKGESEMWCFFRSNKNFDEFSVVIKISKNKDSQEIFISMGTFINNNNGILVLKIFSKEQLIDKSKEKNSLYSEKDICSIKLCVIDNGDENVSCNIFVNDSFEDNFVNSNFFLPTSEKRSVMFAGIGECILKKLISHIMIKDVLNEYRDSTFLSSQKNGCNCCNIY